MPLSDNGQLLWGGEAVFDHLSTAYPINFVCDDVGAEKLRDRFMSVLRTLDEATIIEFWDRVGCYPKVRVWRYSRPDRHSGHLWVDGPDGEYLTLEGDPRMTTETALCILLEFTNDQKYSWRIREPGTQPQSKRCMMWPQLNKTTESRSGLDAGLVPG